MNIFFFEISGGITAETLESTPAGTLGDIHVLIIGETSEGNFGRMYRKTSDRIPEGTCSKRKSRGTIGTIKEVPNPNPEKYPAAIPKGTFGRSFEEVSEEGIPEKKNF